ncbi:CerR family C-terminal domain-containing protein [Mesorhizobium sp. ZC-5]|uniref:CerR family C-terminal domain-containing protein n=1 Tax=Mesorhizobium sp. ZC-5 TaxID=2986066 RepID=UPI0021E86D84|nr:CerR family C-terminal domain-containing protein [Mesorhizobium sp. ZC-5]MCV3239758.1 CerR family C-terminal domain-containing protein [Mesorhizobium sp. ZC-5]
MIKKLDPAPTVQTPPSSADMTRLALIRAALTLFGSKGFDGTSTRDIAALANANIGSIAYHFRGKDGLRLAAADHIVQTIQAIAGQAMGNLDATIPARLEPDAARAQLIGALERMITFIVASPEAGEVVQFVLRELSQPTAALDRIYSGVFEPVHKRLCMLWEQATGEPAESDRTKLTVFTLIGQVVYFRIGREAVRRRMGWTEIGPQQASDILDVARSNLVAVLEGRKGQPS